MRSLILVILSILLLPLSALGDGDFAITGFSESYTVSNTYQVIHEVRPIGPVNYVLRWIPFPRVSSYDGVFQQTPTGTVVLDTDPPAQITYVGGIGSWVFWDASYNTGDILTATLDGTVIITLNLDGAFDDVILDNPDSWTDHTPRAQSIPEAASVAQQLRDNYIAGTCREGYGVVHRIVQYLADTISRGSDLSYEDGSALRAWELGSAECDGFTNLFMSMCRSLDIGAAYMMGNTFAATYLFSGSSTVTFSTIDGAHAWSASDNGSWLVTDPYHHSVGWTTTSRVLEAQAIDQNDVNIQTLWGGAGTIETSMTMSGGGGGEAFIVHDEWDNGGTDLFVHYPDNISLRPLGSEAPVVGIPEGPYLDPSIEHALMPLGNPSYRKVQLRLHLLRPAHRMQVDILNLNGRVVAANVVDRPGRIGDNFVSWTPGNRVASGIYFVRVSFDQGSQVITQKVTYLH